MHLTRSKLTRGQMLAHRPNHRFELRIDKSRTSGFRQATAARKMPAADRLSDALDRLNLLGSWQKDQAASDMHCYGQQLSLLGIKGMKKAAAVRLLNGLNLRSDGSTMSLSFSVDKFSFLNQTEEYALDGSATYMSRRDGRKGEQTALAQPLDDGIQVSIDMPPFQITERYRVQRDELRVESSTERGGKQLFCTQVYSRKS